MNRTNQLTKIHLSGKPYIIYKSQNGFDLYTNFSKKIILNNTNIKSFLTKIKKKTKYIGIIMTPYSPKDKIDCQHFIAFQKKTFTYSDIYLKLKLLDKPYKLGKTNYYFYILKNDI